MKQLHPNCVKRVTRPSANATDLVNAGAALLRSWIRPTLRIHVNNDSAFDLAF